MLRLHQSSWMEEHQNLEEFLNQISGNFTVAEHGVHPDVMQKFIAISNKLGTVQYVEGDVPKLKKKLDSDASSKNLKFRTLAKLASIKGVESFRAIEAYHEVCPDDEKGFVVLALNQSRHLLENDLLDNSTGLIITGLGGRGKKLRYFFLIVLKVDQELGHGIRRLLQSEIEEALSTYESDLEQIEFKPAYIATIALVPLSKNLADIIEDITIKCNTIQQIFLENFFVTNGFYPTNPYLDSIVQKLRNQKTEQGEL
jgi:hypothetical protein